jgi:hypothetical protein
MFRPAFFSMPRIVTVRSKGSSKEDVISLVLSQDAVSEGPGGDPWCGVTLTPDQAHCLAERLWNLAVEIESSERCGYRTSPPLFEQVTSVVVLHDGSQQSHRAFQAAVQCASRALGTLDFIGLFGIDISGSETTAKVDNREWQRNWLIQLVNMYSEQAQADGVTFNSKLLPANDPCFVLDMLYRMEFDLLVMPKSLTDFGIHGERLMSSIIGRRNANVLVCA